MNKRLNVVKNNNGMRKVQLEHVDRTKRGFAHFWCCQQVGNWSAFRLSLVVSAATYKLLPSEMSNTLRQIPAYAHL